ncbi:MAG TPA: phosphatase PAP2 family protein [Tepidiformaceae bacterium]|nr:phosphatase PAP2 family protein [Tepidiformaceae bacterium]
MSAMTPHRYSAPWYADRYRWRLASREILGTSAILIVYFLLRGLRPDSVEDSVGRSLHLIRFEQRLGLFQEVTWQHAFIGHTWLIDVANLVYAWGHYPVLLAIALWLVIKDPIQFRFVRNVMFLSAALGIMTYYLLPAAPPRLMAANGYDFGFIDTVHSAASNAHYVQPGPFVNDYAALPSFHFGWILLATLAIWHNTDRPWIRAAAVTMSVVMFWAITVTGNHYFFDMAFGAAVVLVSWVVVDAISSRRDRPDAPATISAAGSD